MAGVGLPTGDSFSKMTHIKPKRREVYRMAGLHLKERPRAARVALYTPKLSRKPRTVAMIMNADTAKRLSLHAHPRLANIHGLSVKKPQSHRVTSWLPSQACKFTVCKLQRRYLHQNQQLSSYMLVLDCPPPELTCQACFACHDL